MKRRTMRHATTGTRNRNKSGYPLAPLRQTCWLFCAIMIVVVAITVLFPTYSAAQSLTYPVVDTGQTNCYDANIAIPCPTAGELWYGQDGQVAGHAPAYTNNEDGTISDLVTGLMWQQSPDTNADGTINHLDKLTYHEAVSYCDNLSLASYSDWWLPDIKQLYSLINFQGTDPGGPESENLTPFLDVDYFAFAYGDTRAGERVIDAQYASSMLYVDRNQSMAGMFGVNFADGRIKGYPVNNVSAFYTRCVRGNSSYGQNHLVNNGDGTVTDQATGLMWSQSDSGSGLDWQEALDWVSQQNAANYLGYNDWRLPNAKELQSIVDYSRSPGTTDSAAIDPLFNATRITNEAGQPDYPSYWSSTTHLNASQVPATRAVYVAFGRAMGYMPNTWTDVHGAGAQRSDPKQGDPSAWPTGQGPQGDAIRILNFVRLVRDATSSDITTTPTTTAEVPTTTPTYPAEEPGYRGYLPRILR